MIAGAKHLQSRGRANSLDQLFSARHGCSFPSSAMETSPLLEALKNGTPTKDVRLLINAQSVNAADEAGTGQFSKVTMFL